jgi:hypothetical protein
MIKDYDKMLFDIIKPLALLENPVKIYHNVVDTDYNSQSKDYIVYSTGITNTPRLYGDGSVLLRRCSCDITVVEGGTGNNDNSGYLVKMVEDLLVQHKIPYTKISMGYVESTDSMQTTFDFYLI